MARAQPRWPTIKLPPKADSPPPRREWRIAVCGSCSGWERFYDGAPGRPCPWCDDGALEQVVVVEVGEGLAERLEGTEPLTPLEAKAALTAILLSEPMTPDPPLEAAKAKLRARLGVIPNELEARVLAALRGEGPRKFDDIQKRTAIVDYELRTVLYSLLQAGKIRTSGDGWVSMETLVGLAREDE